MAHKASLAKDHFPAIEIILMLVALMKSIAWRPLQSFGGRHRLFEHSMWQLGKNNRRQADQMSIA